MEHGIKPTKQVLVWRNDLKVRKGKMGAQLSHGSLAFLTRDGKWKGNDFVTSPDNAEEAKIWMEHSFTKVVLKVNSEAELLQVYQKAKEAGLVAHLIIDKGLTEFGGVPTKTVVAIGPHFSEKIDPITGHLELM